MTAYGQGGYGLGTYGIGESTSGTIVLGLATETDTALAASVATRVSLGVASETESAASLTLTVGLLVIPLGLATEIDTARAVLLSATVPLGIAAETDAAPAATMTVGVLVVHLGLATETDAAPAVVLAAGVMTLDLGVADEEDAAPTLAALLVVVGTQASRSGGRRRLGIATATWSPAVVDPPEGPSVTVVQYAQAFPFPAIVATGGQVQAIYEPDVVMRPAERYRVLVGGVDVTFFRGVATPEPDYQLQQPLGYGPATLTFPQVLAAFENPGAGDLAFMAKGKPVLVQRVDTTTGQVVATDYRGIVLAYDNAGKDLTVEVGGDAQGRAALEDKPLPIFKHRNDLGFWWWGLLKDLRRPFAPRLGPDTGIVLGNTGGTSYLEYAQQLSAKGTTRGGAQWTCMPDEDGVYSVARKDLVTVHATAYNDDARLVANLRSDLAEEPNEVYATGVSPHGRRIRFGGYPLLSTAGRRPKYPIDNGDQFGVGTTDADTDSGDGVTVMLWRLEKAGYLEFADTPGGYDSDVAAAIRALKRDAGITPVNGTMGPQAWKALFDIAVTGYDIAGSKILPAARDPHTDPWRRSSSGAVLGRNPSYDPALVVVSRSVDMGVDMTREQMRGWAEDTIEAAQTPNHVGTLTFNTGALVVGDHDGSPLTIADVLPAKALRPGMNVRLPHYAGGIVVHVSAISVTAGLVTATVDTRARDAMQVWEVVQRNRDSRRDPARSWLRDHRSSGNNKDAITEFDEYGGIVEPMLLDRGWNVFPVVAGQEGTVARIRVKVGTEHGVSPAGHGSPYPAQDRDPCEFVTAVFGAEIKVKRLRQLVPSPLGAGEKNRWMRPSVRDTLDRESVLLYVAGEHDQPCGYYPRSKSADMDVDVTETPATGDPGDVDVSDVTTTSSSGVTTRVEVHSDGSTTTTVSTPPPLTGRWSDDAGFGYRTFGDPVLWVAIYCADDTALKGGRILFNQAEAGS